MTTPNYHRYGSRLVGFGPLDERKWNRAVRGYYAAHPEEQVPSIVEAAKRHEAEAAEELERLERGECCGRCSASGLCGSQYWGLLYIRHGSGQCPKFEYERGIDNWLREILGAEYDEYVTDRNGQEAHCGVGQDNQVAGQTARHAM